MATVVRSRFYWLIACALALVIFGGFARTFYLRSWFDVPPLTMLLYVHGFVFSVWVALFVVQTRLIATNNIRVHMRVGIAGVAMAALVVVIGVLTVVVSARIPRDRPLGLTAPQFTIVPLMSVALFAALAGAAVVQRRKPQVHKRLMTLAMISVLGPPVARLIVLIGQPQHYLGLQTGVVVVFVVWCLVADWLRHRIVHPVYSLGGALLIASWPLRATVAHTETWTRVGNWMAGLG